MIRLLFSPLAYAVFLVGTEHVLKYYGALPIVSLHVMPQMAGNLKSPKGVHKQHQVKIDLKEKTILFLSLVMVAEIEEIARNIKEVVDTVKIIEHLLSNKFCTGYQEKAFILKCIFK